MKKKIDVEKNKFVFEDLKDEFNASEQDAIKFQINYSIHKLTQKLNKERVVNSILILHNNQSISNLLNETLNQLYKDASISILNFNEIDYKLGNKFDLLFIFDDGTQKNIDLLLKNLKFKKKFYIDINMNISIKSGMIIRFIKTIYYNRKFYIQEPMLIFWKIGKIFKSILKKV